MSSPKLSENPSSHTLEENRQGDTFIFSEQQIQSNEDLEDDLNINNDSILLDQDIEGICDDDLDNVSDQMDELDDFNDHIDQEQYFEEQAAAIYQFTLMRKALAVLYKNGQAEVEKKMLFNEIMNKINAIRYFKIWKSTLYEQSLSSNIEDQQEQNLILQSNNDTQEEQQYLQYCDQQMQLNLKQNDSQKYPQYEEMCSPSGSNLVNPQSSHIEQSYNTIKTNDNGYHFHSLSNEKNTNRDFGSSPNEDQYKKSDSLSSAEKHSKYIKKQNECDHELEFKGVSGKSSQTNQLNNCFDNQEYEESDEGLISENQFIDQDQFNDDFQSENSNYHSQYHAKSFQNGNKTVACTNGLDIILPHHQQIQKQSYQTPTDRLIHLSGKRKECSRSSVDDKMRQSHHTGNEFEPEKGRIESGEEELIMLNGNQHASLPILIEGRIFDEQNQSFDDCQNEKDASNELHVEKSVYDEKSIEILSTKKESLHSARQFQALSHRPHRDEEPEKRGVRGFLSPEKENEKFYRKNSPIQNHNIEYTDYNNKDELALQLADKSINNEITISFSDKLFNNKTQPGFEIKTEDNQFNKEENQIDNCKIKNHSDSVYGTQRNQFQINYLELNEESQRSSLSVDPSSSYLIAQGDNNTSEEGKNLSKHNKQTIYFDQNYNEHSPDQYLLQKLANSTDHRKNSQQEEQINSARDNYITYRNNNDQRLSQIEIFSVSKNIELTPTQQYMIYTSRGNNHKANPGQSISEMLEEEIEQLEQEEVDLANEVFLQIFGKKFFRKLRVAYHLTQYSSNEQLRQQQEKIVTMRKCFERFKELKRTNFKKREVQSKLFEYYELRYIRRPLKKWFENNKIFQAQQISLSIVYNAVVKLNCLAAFQQIQKFASEKKRESTVNNLLKYYERKSSLANRQKLSSNNHDKREKNTFNKREQSQNGELNEVSYVQKRKFDDSSLHVSQFETENCDKENNINSGNVQRSFLEAGRYSKQRENQQPSLKRSLNKKENQYDVQQPLKINGQSHTSQCNQPAVIMVQSDQNNLDLSLLQKSSSSLTAFQYKNNKEMPESMNNPKSFQPLIQNNVYHMQRQNNMLSNFQSIQSTALGHYVSTEISDNDLNNNSAKIIQSEQSQATQSSSSQQQLQEIYHLINDRSSMVFDCSKKVQNSQNFSSNNLFTHTQPSQNTARSISSCSNSAMPQNPMASIQTVNYQQTGKFVERQNNNNLHLLKQNASIPYTSDSIEQNLCTKNTIKMNQQFNKSEQQVPTKNSNPSPFITAHQRISSEVCGQNLNPQGKSIYDKNSSQSYLQQNIIYDIPNNIKLEDNNNSISHMYISEQTTERLQQSRNGLGLNKKPQVTDNSQIQFDSRATLRTYLNEKKDSTQSNTTKQLELVSTQRNQCKETVYPPSSASATTATAATTSLISLSPIPCRRTQQINNPTHLTPEQIQINNNQSFKVNQTPLPYYSYNSTNISKHNSDALSFTHSQIKNSLNVSTNLNSQLNAQNNEFTPIQLKESENSIPNQYSQSNSSQPLNPSCLQKEAGKIKRNHSTYNQKQQPSDQVIYPDFHCSQHDKDKGVLIPELPHDDPLNYQQVQTKVNPYAQYRENNMIRNRISSSLTSDRSFPINNNELTSTNHNLVSFINRNDSSNRINQQLQQQAEAFNSRKQSTSRNQQVSQSGNLHLQSSQNPGSKTQLEIMNQSKHNTTNITNNKELSSQNQGQHLNQSCLHPPKPPLHLRATKPTEAENSRRQNEKQIQLQEPETENLKYDNFFKENHLKIKSHYQQKSAINIAEEFSTENLNIPNNRRDLKTFNSSSDFSHEQISQRNLIKNKDNQEVNESINENSINTELQSNKTFQLQKEIINKTESSQRSPYPQNSQTHNDHNNKNPYLRQSTDKSSPRSSSINPGVHQNFENHLKNKQFSQSILEAAQQVSQNSQNLVPPNKRKAEQINQLKQYQYFKQIQKERPQLKQSDHANSSFTSSNNNNNNSMNNNTRQNSSNNGNSKHAANNNTSFSRVNQSRESQRNSKNPSRNVSIEKKKQIDLTDVGQNIQNILYLEAKIRSKRIARSSERSKNDSMELCKKLDNLENYIQQINHELENEKDKRIHIIQENASLLDQKERSRIY